MASKCPKCDKTVYFAEKVSSLGKDWHKFCLKCERCNKTLTPGGHAEHDGKPFCHKPCYATLFGPKGVNIGGAGSYIYEKPQIEGQSAPGPIEHPARVEERKVNAAPPKGPSKGEWGGTGHLAGGGMRCPTLMGGGCWARAPWWHLVALGVCPVVALGGRTPGARRWLGSVGFYPKR
uniref:Cysteine-rich protein 2 n=1 Tax=Chrysolophus pictus TaxID=9089 RepID=A0A8C3Q121_CHRPC